jgi:hypothetical protein
MVTAQQKTQFERLSAKVLRDVLSGESFVTTSDLADTLKHRLARLRIPYGGRDVSRAFELVGSNRRLVVTPITTVTVRPPRPPASTEPPALSPREADALLRHVGASVSGMQLVSAARAEARRGDTWPEFFPNLVAAV